jgi:hypothetical protein
VKGATTSYDEELTPEIDPPIVEPPPAATTLGRIFAHRRSRRTVVEAPLVPLEATAPAPDARAEPVAEPAPDPVPDPLPDPAPPEPAATEPEVATRYCRECGGRVPLAADGQHCRDGHRLSPAHARKGGLLRRLFGRG